MNYTVYYDLIEAGYPAAPVLYGLAFVVGTLGMKGAFHLFGIGNPKSRVERLLWRVVIVLGIGFTVVVGGGLYSDYARLRSQMAGGHCDVVEGEVSDFTPGQPQGRVPESFRVGEVTFRYSHYDLDNGFHQTVPAGGPVKEGRKVRITYVDESGRRRIVRLEIAKP